MHATDESPAATALRVVNPADHDRPSAVAKILAACAVVLLSCALAVFDAERNQTTGWRPEAVGSPLLLSADGIRQLRSSAIGDATAFPAAPCTLRRVRLADLEGEPTEPVIIVDLQNGWVAHHRWKKAELLRHHGSIEVWVGDSLAMGREGPETVSAGVVRERQRLGDFVRSGMEGRYTFDRSTVFEDYPSLRDDFSLPAPFRPSASATSVCNLYISQISRLFSWFQFRDQESSNSDQCK